MYVFKMSATFMTRCVAKNCFLRRSKCVSTPTQTASQQLSTETHALTVSHVRGPTDVPINLQPFGQILEEKCGKLSDRILVKSIEQQVQLTYGEALREADRFAAGLLSLGLQKGDRVVLWAPNTWQWVIAHFALVRSGLVTVPVNPSTGGEEAIHCLTLTRPAAIITPAEYKNIKYHDLILQIAPELRDSKPGKAKCAKIPDLRAAICIGGKTPEFAVGFEELSNSASESDITGIKCMQKDFGPEDSIILPFSSGTSGKPKATVITHKGYVNISKAIADMLPITDRAKPVVHCVQVPLFHIFGLVGVISMGVHLGAQTILPSSSYSPKANLKALIEEKCTIISGTPTMYLDMIRRTEQDGRPLHETDVGITGAAPLVPQLGKNILDVLRMKRLHVMYGMSEAAGTIFQTTPNDSLEQMCESVGKIVNNMEAKIVDPDGKTVPVNTPGELWIRGYSTMKEYFGQPDKTKESITEDGWLRSGDQFVINEMGYAKVIGRFKDIIIRGGENISPKEIEDVLTTHPSVIDVQVVGVKDVRLGEECCACFIVRKPISGQEIYETCKDKISSFKIPRYYAIMDGYPRTASGKIQKYKLRDICDTLLNEDKLLQVLTK